MESKVKTDVRNGEVCDVRGVDVPSYSIQLPLYVQPALNKWILLIGFGTYTHLSHLKMFP